MPDLKQVTPCSHGRFAQLLQLLRVSSARVIIAAHAARIDGPAEQLVDRHPEDLAANVPQRLVDAGDRRADHRTGAIEAVDVHRLPVMLHLHRVLADQELAEIFDAGDHGGGLAFERSLAPADEPLLVSSLTKT